jgi:hypothetical protein
MQGILYTQGPFAFWIFLLVTLVLGGAAAWATGRAIARTWRPPTILPVYMLALAAAVRFLHYALFAESFFSPHYYLVDYVVLVVAAGLGYRRTRARQMVRQYGWDYVSRGFFFWLEKTPMDSPPAPMG